MYCYYDIYILLLAGRSAWHGGVGWGGDEARCGARRWPVSAWWAGAGGQSSDNSQRVNPEPCRRS